MDAFLPLLVLACPLGMVVMMLWMAPEQEGRWR